MRSRPTAASSCSTSTSKLRSSTPELMVQQQRLGRQRQQQQLWDNLTSSTSLSFNSSTSATNNVGSSRRAGVSTTTLHLTSEAQTLKKVERNKALHILDHWSSRSPHHTTSRCHRSSFNILRPSEPCCLTILHIFSSHYACQQP